MFSSILNVKAESVNYPVDGPIETYYPIFGNLSYYGTFINEDSDTVFFNYDLVGPIKTEVYYSDPFHYTYYASSTSRFHSFDTEMSYQGNGYYCTSYLYNENTYFYQDSSCVNEFIISDFVYNQRMSEYFENIIFDLSTSGGDFRGMTYITLDYYQVEENVEQYYDDYLISIDMTEPGLPLYFNLHEVLQNVSSRPIYVENMTISFQANPGYGPQRDDWYYFTIQYDVFEEQTYNEINLELRESYSENLNPVEFVTPVSWLLDSVGSFFQFEIFPGFSLGGLIGIVTGIGLFIMILKVFLGG